MIERLYSRVQKLKKQNNSSWKLMFKINKALVNVFYPIEASLDRKQGIDEESHVIVSLTTYPARIKTVWLTVASLLNQTYKPKKVILYLSKEQFSSGETELPRKLIQLKKRGLEIVFVDGDLKPHKKYYYAFRDYPDYMVVTADDDIFYPENHIERLVSAAEKYPAAVICDRSHKIDISKEYNHWEDNSTNEPDMLTLPVGCNAVLYRPRLFDEEIYDAEKINEYALFTDDLWLKAMEIRNNIKAFNCSDEPLIFFNNIFSMNTGLWRSNANNDNEVNRNDVVWNKLLELYPDIRGRLV